MANELDNQSDLLNEAEENTTEGIQNAELDDIIGGSTPENCCNTSGCLPNVEFDGAEKMSKPGSKKVENQGANNENGAANGIEMTDAKFAVKKLLEALKQKETITPEQRIDKEAKVTAASMAREIAKTGELSEATMKNISSAFERAGRSGGAEGQERFMRQLNLSLQQRNMFMLHNAGEAEDGVTPHRIVVSHSNGQSFADGNFTSRAPQRKGQR
ncbi:MAG: hypothetical protein K2W95_05995 [Candidatus Obscuribacterales bacterium]|nr:hypothetical protein [Candidatus Obscuribacterales bacterium]